MSGDTLVLSASWTPVRRVSWERALILWLNKKIEIVEEYEDRYIRSQSFSIKMPSVVRYLRKVKAKAGMIRFSRDNVYTRDEGKCQYCSQKVSRVDFTFDHVIPRAEGGQTRWDNVVVACMPCNQRKGCRTPDAAGMRLLSQPTKPKGNVSDRMVFTFRWDKSMPASWASYVRDIGYWHGELDG